MKFLDGAVLNQSEIEQRVLNEYISPLVYISANFSLDILRYNQSENIFPPTVDIYYLPEHRRFGEAVLNAVWDIVNEEPFQRVDLIKDTDFSIQVVTYEGEESAGSTFFTGFIGFIVIMLSVIAPGPYVSSSFAGEKEKGTLESLISLPMSRFDILLSKLIAGMGLVTIFSFMNILGLMLYQTLINQANLQTDTEVLGAAVNLGPAALVSIFFMILLTSFASIGLGICIASLISDTRTAESAYTLIMMVPAMIVGFAAMYGSLPEGFSLLLLIPWTHSLLILNKGLFPQTYADYALTSSIHMDILVHIGFLLVFVAVSLYIASKLFDRESMIK
jgi:sodium transport system permease protein